MYLLRFLLFLLVAIVNLLDNNDLLRLLLRLLLK